MKADTVNYLEWQGSLLRHLGKLLGIITENNFSTNYARFNVSIANLDKITEVRGLLADDKSVAVLDALIKIYLASGFVEHQEVFRIFPLFSDELWAEYSKAAASAPKYAEKYHEMDVIETWVLHGYSYDKVCCVEKGDTVIDAGAYTGNTAIFFGLLAEDKGAVYAFEPISSIFNELERNAVKANRELNTNIKTVNSALSDKTGTTSFSDKGFASSERAGGPLLVNADTIDNFVSVNRIATVDFIKMDIEGSEMSALVGAEKTIKKNRPKLAICVYHKSVDIFEIPLFIRSLGLSYDFYLKHNSRNTNETVLFCNPSAVQANAPKISKTESKVKNHCVDLIAGNVKSMYEAAFEKLVDKQIRSFFDGVLRQFRICCRVPLKEKYPEWTKLELHLPFSQSGVECYRVKVAADKVSIFVSFLKDHHAATLCKEIEISIDSVLAHTVFRKIDINGRQIAYGYEIPRVYGENSTKQIGSILASLVNATIVEIANMNLASCSIVGYLAESQLLVPDSTRPETRRAR
jgi:FkbM family methyltransferase